MAVLRRRAAGVGPRQRLLGDLPLGPRADPDRVAGRRRLHRAVSGPVRRPRPAVPRTRRARQPAPVGRRRARRPGADRDRGRGVLRPAARRARRARAGGRHRLLISDRRPAAARARRRRRRDERLAHPRRVAVDRRGDGDLRGQRCAVSLHERDRQLRQRRLVLRRRLAARGVAARLRGMAAGTAAAPLGRQRPMDDRRAADARRDLPEPARPRSLRAHQRAGARARDDRARRRARAIGDRVRRQRPHAPGQPPRRPHRRAHGPAQPARADVRPRAGACDRRPVVLGLFDLDGFKHYNDSFGHAAGDALLARLGKRSSSTSATAAAPTGSVATSSASSPASATGPWRRRSRAPARR